MYLPVYFSIDMIIYLFRFEVFTFIAPLKIFFLLIPTFTPYTTSTDFFDFFETLSSAIWYPNMV